MKWQVYCCGEEPGEILEKKTCGQGVSCLTVCGIGGQDDEMYDWYSWWGHDNVDSDDEDLMMMVVVAVMWMNLSQVRMVRLRSTWSTSPLMRKETARESASATLVLFLRTRTFWTKKSALTQLFRSLQHTPMFTRWHFCQVKIESRLLYAICAYYTRDHRLGSSRNTLDRILKNNLTSDQDHYYKHPGPVPQPTETFIKATSSSIGNQLVSRKKRQTIPTRYLNIPRTQCFNGARVFRNLLNNPSRNGECCLSNKIAERPKALDVCCSMFVDGAADGGYLSQCPTVPRGGRRQRDRDGIFNNNRRGKREL